MWSRGEHVGEYEIVEPIRSGGMASLYLAKKRGVAGFVRHVAIKVVHPKHSRNPRLVRMFLDEARLCARIHHPNVVHVEELGEHRGTHYLVMEYVSGCSLRQLMEALHARRRAMAVDLAVAIATRALDGLHAAHECVSDAGDNLGVVHRDISPPNILVAFQGYVKLIDFGVAKAKSHEERTRTGVLKGKFRYMSPEQASQRTVDRRTDIFAMGVVLWEMLTQRPLFDADSPNSVLRRIMRSAVLAPSHYNPDVPSMLDHVILSSLAVVPEHRPQTAYEFRNQLIAARPSSVGIDSTQLADVLHALMPEAIHEEKRRMQSHTTGHTQDPRNERLGRLVVRNGNQAGEEIVLSSTHARWVVGRAERCGFILKDADASRLHFEIVLAQGQTWVRDLGSKNGVYVNGERIQECALTPGDLVQVGSTWMDYTEASTAYPSSGKPSAQAEAALETLTHQTE